MGNIITKRLKITSVGVFRAIGRFGVRRFDVKLNVGFVFITVFSQESAF